MKNRDKRRKKKRDFLKDYLKDKLGNWKLRFGKEPTSNSKTTTQENRNLDWIIFGCRSSGIFHYEK